MRVKTVMRIWIGVWVAIWVAIIVSVLWAIQEEHQARRACYRLGYEFVDGDYFGGTTFCAERSGATRRIITIQR